MISELCCDEQEELADHKKSNDNHYQGPHRRRRRRTHKISVVHWKHSLLSSVQKKICLWSEKTCTCGAFEVKWTGGGRLLLSVIHLRCIGDRCACGSAPCDGCFPFCLLNEQNLSRRVGCLLWQRLFFILKCHLPSCTSCEKAGTESVK